MVLICTSHLLVDEINGELLSSELESAHPTGRSGYISSDALKMKTPRAHSPLSMLRAPCTSHRIPCTTADVTDSWKGKETINPAHYSRPAVNGHHMSHHSPSFQHSDRLGSYHSLRHSDTVLDHQKPAYRGELRTSGPVMDIYQYPDIRVPPSVLKDSGKPFEEGKYCSATAFVNGHTAHPSFDVEVPKHRCTHGRGPSASLHLPSYQEHIQRSRTWDYETKDPREVTFEKHDKQETELKEEDKEKVEKDDKEKKKEKKDKKKRKKKKRDKSSSSSSSSASSSSDSDSNSDKDVKKKKKGRKKDKGRKKEKKEADKPQRQPDVTPVVKSDRTKVQAPHMQPPKDGRMNFYNDSGTQINYWGLKPAEVNRVVNGVLSGRTPYPGPKGQGLGYPAEIAHPEDTQSREQHRLPLAQGSYNQQLESDEEPALQASHEPHENEPQEAPLTKGQQQEQQFFKKFFKGWGSKSKDKDKDSRVTVRTMDGAGDGKVSYEKIRDECLKKGNLWEDPEFPAHDSSLYFSKEEAVSGVKWMRPSVSQCNSLLDMEHSTKGA